MADFCIVTSEDYWLAPIVRERLVANGHGCRILNVRLRVRNDFWKKLKLALLFGPLAMVRILAKSKRAEAALEGISDVDMKTCLALVETTPEIVLLMNFPKKFPVLHRPVYNFHPAVLPSYKGLMSLPRITLDKLRGDRRAQYGVTIHEIEKSFDTGRVVWRDAFSDQSPRGNFAELYERAYLASATGIVEVSNGAMSPSATDVAPSYSKTFTWSEVAELQLRLWVRSVKALLVPRLARAQER